MSYDPNSGGGPYGGGQYQGGQHQQWSGYGQPTEPPRRSSGAVIALIVVLTVLVLALLGAVAYLIFRSDSGGQGAAPAVPDSQSSWATTGQEASGPVTATTTVTPQAQPTVTVTAPAPAPGVVYPVGADRSGWTGDRSARCNAGDPAAMIGRTTQARFSICVNPDNGRYYYRGSADGLGVEVDDPLVSGSSASVSNNDVVYSISPSGMVIYQAGQVISQQEMLDFWVG